VVYPAWVVNLETTLDDVTALFPDERNRGEETEELRRLAGQARIREESPAGPWEIVEGLGLAFSAPHATPPPWPSGWPEDSAAARSPPLMIRSAIRTGMPAARTSTASRPWPIHHQLSIST
jgi:hypothetical protein